MVISSITSKDNYYLDRLFELDENIQTYYLNIIEKYIEVGVGAKDKAKNLDQTLNKTQNDLKMTSNGEFIQELELKNDNLVMKYNELEKEFMELNMRHKDSILEINFLRSKNQNSNEVQEDLINNTVMISQLKNELETQENEIDDLKRDLELQIRRSTEEKLKLKVI